MNSPKPTVAIAGATGFVGQALIPTLLEDHRVIGLTRSPTRAALPDGSGVEWRHCDLFNLEEVVAALEGVDYAIYLVHSMMPSAKLVQASFADMDLLLADNFARAAERNGAKRLVYVGGIRPDDAKPSAHLSSRLEVEQTLGGRATPVTAIRAGIILGPGGSSMKMMVELVRRLPAMILPSWTRSRSSPIAVDDVVRVVRRCMHEDASLNGSFDIGGPEVMSYREMMRRAAQLLKRKIPMLPVPFFSPALSRHWVALITGTSTSLVGPLVDSLRHSVVPEPNWMLDWVKEKAVSFETALRRSIDDEGRPLPNPRTRIRSGDDAQLKQGKTVRSVQRMIRPEHADAAWVADEYVRWLPSMVWPFLCADIDEANCVVRFRVRFTRIALLELSLRPSASTPDLRIFEISGGFLARTGPDVKPGWFELREVMEREAIIAAIHDFRPTLPWLIYSLTQAKVHLFVMRRFGAHLKRVQPREELPARIESGKPQPPERV